MRWPMMLSSKGSQGTCIPCGISAFLHAAFTAHRVVAIDNDRLVLLERCGSLAIELWQRDMYRPEQVLCLVLLLSAVTRDLLCNGFE